MNDLDMNGIAEAARTAEAGESGGSDIFSLLGAAHALEARVEAALAGVGLSIPKLSVISELVRSGEPLALGELATRLSCVKSNMTQLVDRLESDGLVRRVDDPSDRRAVKAAITDKGREKAAAGAAEIDRLNRALAAAVQGDDRAAVERVVAALQ
jgi:DNA-binding MarR family transcriptional regulator